MPKRGGKISRRDFIRTAGAAGLGSVLIPVSASSTAHGSASSKPSEETTVPTRPFGRTGVNVSILALGGELKPSDQIIFRQAFKMGVTYWDTADSYGWGKNEKAIGSESDDALNLTENLIKKGYTAEQAKLKAVWQNPDIASICSAMPNMTVLQANVAAAVNKTELTGGDWRRMAEYARRTAPGYCAGCADICESAVDLPVPISDIMRFSMYHQSYGDRDTASKLFNALPASAAANILEADYSKAERACPQKIKIGQVLKQAQHQLG